MTAWAKTTGQTGGRQGTAGTTRTMEMITGGGEGTGTRATNIQVANVREVRASGTGAEAGAGTGTGMMGESKNVVGGIDCTFTYSDLRCTAEGHAPRQPRNAVTSTGRQAGASGEQRQWRSTFLTLLSASIL